MEVGRLGGDGKLWQWPVSVAVTSYNEEEDRINIANTRDENAKFMG